jgi:hypothetical protein
VQHCSWRARGCRCKYPSSPRARAQYQPDALASHKGEIPADFADRPAPDPATFGLPTEDDGTRNDTLLGQNIISGTHYELDFDSLRAAQTRIVLAAGSESEGEMANRGTHAVADRQGTTPVTFPSDHGGFFGGEYG